MSATIRYEIDGGSALPTARPDAFWCELVRRFGPEKSKERGDGDPYGVYVIILSQDHEISLKEMVADGWSGSQPLVDVVSDGGTVTITRTP